MNSDEIELEKYLIDKLMALVSETRIPAEVPDELILFTVLKYERDIIKRLKENKNATKNII